MRKSLSTSGSSLRIAFIFVALTATLLLGGLLLKVFLILQASTFDGAHQYILEVDENRTKGMLVAFNPDKKTITGVLISGSSGTSFSKTLSVPTDNTIHMQTTQHIDTLMSNLFWQRSGGTIIDKLRLLLFTDTLSPKDIQLQNITLPLDNTTRENLLPTIFLDSTTYAENETVAIVNATGIGGIGTNVATQLATIGVNVISVTTASTVQDTTTITSSRPHSYTSQRIEKLFHVHSIEDTNQSISDITLIIGKNSLSQLQ